MTETPSSLRRRMPPADRAKQLLRSAEEVFARAGFHASTMDEIARHAGVTRTVLYQHYSSKDDLAAASLAGSHRRLRRIIEQARDTHADPYLQLQAMLRDAIVFVSNGGALYSTLLIERAFTGTKASRQAELIRKDMEAAVVQLLGTQEDGAKPDCRDLHACALVGAVERVAETLVAPAPSQSRTTEIADRLLALFWHGLQPHYPAPR